MNHKIKTFDNSVGDNKTSVKEYLIEYINDSKIADVFKNEILDENFLRENPGYYIDYPYLFASIFHIDNDDILKRLSIAGFLYYKSTILIDRVLDSSYPISKALPLVTVCQEECVKVLSSLFPLTSSFWIYWNKRKMEFYHAYMIDSKTHDISSYEDFEKLSDGKSALGKLAIDALYVLGKEQDKEQYELMLKAHKYFYCTFQILDDISDFREDLQQNQFNIGFWSLKKEMIAQKNHISGQIPIDTLAKYFHVYGVSSNLLELALEYLNKVFSIIHTYHLKYWEVESMKLWNTVITQFLNINGYIKTVEVKEKLSNTLELENTIQNSYDKGLSFLFSMQNENGSWNEYCNNAGVSDVWSTAFISSFLSELKLPDNKAEKFSLALDYLGKNKYMNLWGYNKQWIEDIDSSVFALLSIPEEKSSREFQFILSKQKEDGGFSTYYDEKDLKSTLCNYGNNRVDVKGWIQSHPCVSSSALYLMTKRNFQGKQYDSLLDYFKKNYSIDNLWQPYWWTDTIYCLYFLVKSLPYIDDRELKKLISISVESIVSKQNENGNFCNNVLYTSMMIGLLCHEEKFYKIYSANVEKAIHWLLNNQFSDGSWQSSYSMIMPGADVLIPVNVKEWPVKTRGINIKADDFSRLYSTVSAVSAINIYANRKR